MTMGEVDLQEVHDFLINVAHDAGIMVASAKPEVAGHGTKKNSAGEGNVICTCSRRDVGSDAEQTSSLRQTKLLRRWLRKP